MKHASLNQESQKCLGIIPLWVCF